MNSPYYIELKEASTGGFVPSKTFFRYQLIGQETISKSIINDSKQADIPIKHFKIIIEWIKNALTPLPSMTSRTDNIIYQYNGPNGQNYQLTVKTPNFSWFNTNPTGCIHSGPSKHRPNQSQILLYRQIVDNLIKLASAQ